MSLLPPPDMSKSSLSQIITRMAALSTKLSASIIEANGSEPIQLRNTPDKMKDIGNNAVIRPSTSRVSTEDLKIVDELRNEVSAITENLLQIKLPHPSPEVNAGELKASSFTTAVISTESMDTVVFGLRKRGDSLPLHDHKQMYGFMRSLRGKLRVTSFSWLDPEQELDYMNRSMLDVRTNELSGRHNSVIKRPARFEGDWILSSEDKNSPHAVAILGPKTGNVHRVEALTDGAAFFDLLIPGYQEFHCNYYSLAKVDVMPKVGEIVWLYQISEPTTFTMQCIDYELPFVPPNSEEDADNDGALKNG